VEPLRIAILPQLATIISLLASSLSSEDAMCDDAAYRRAIAVDTLGEAGFY
jgi:hypothetical protein